MELSGRFLLAWAVWCFWDQVHSVPFHKNEGLLPRRLSVATPTHKMISECGISRITDLKIGDKLSIMGGLPAELGDWPWMVALFHGKSFTPIKAFFCGGTLISKQWVVTAGHCVTNSSMKPRYARLGAIDLGERIQDLSASPSNIMIDKIEPHPQYNVDPLINDIALVHLVTPVEFTDFLRPICLFKGQEYNTNEYYETKRASIAGWGRAELPSQNVSKKLLAAEVDVVRHEDCAEQYSNLTNKFLIDEKVICASRINIDACKADTGGPLMFLSDNKERFYLGGVISEKYKCADLKYPGIYTKAAQYTSWISQVTGEEF